MEITNFSLIVITIVLLIEVGVVYCFIEHIKFRQLISSTKTSKISDLSDGFHEVKGQVVSLGKSLVSPFSEKTCVYYEFVVEEKRNVRRNPYENNNGQAEWDNLFNDEKRLKFGVDDGSGIAIVDLKDARIELKSENEFSADNKIKMEVMSSLDRERVINKLGVKTSDTKNERTLRFRELILEEGIQVYVIGEVHGQENGRPLFEVQGKPLYVSDNSESELLELYANKFVFSFVVMISIPLGILCFWLMGGF